MAVDLLLCVATDLEGTLLRDQARRSGASMAIIRTGVGEVNAAHAVTLFVARECPHTIVVCGVGGAYPDSGLRMGDVVCAESEFYGDLGATSPAGFLNMEDLGFPIVESRVPFYDRVPMHVFPVARRAPFVTVTSLTGTDTGAREMQRRTGGAVESMEGAAVAHVSALHGIDVGEVRAINNIVR